MWADISVRYCVTVISDVSEALACLHHKDVEYVKTDNCEL
jgi:hypothetical protein